VEESTSGRRGYCYLTGTGSLTGAGTMNDGIFLSGGSIFAIADIILHGTGGAGSSVAGVGISSGSSIVSYAGPITVTGSSQNGSSGDGIDVTGGSRVTIDRPTTGHSITLTGSASHGQNVYVDPTSTVTM
jgi:hypothetical protein